MKRFFERISRESGSAMCSVIYSSRFLAESRPPDCEAGLSGRDSVSRPRMTDIYALASAESGPMPPTSAMQQCRTSGCTCSAARKGEAQLLEYRKQWNDYKTAIEKLMVEDERGGEND